MDALRALRLIKAESADGGASRLSPSPSSSSTAAAVASPRVTPFRLFHAGGEKENGTQASRGGATSSSPRAVTRPARAVAGAGGGSDDRSMSIYDDPPVSVTGGKKVGRIQFSLKYNDSTLTLKIMRAIDLPVMDYMTGTSDPYVKVMLLPDKRSKLSTSIKRKNLNPRWNEIFEFEGFPQSKLVNRILYMQMFDYDRFSRDDPMGEVCVPLGELDLSEPRTIWKNLQPCKGHATTFSSTPRHVSLLRKARDYIPTAILFFLRLPISCALMTSTYGKLGELLISLCYQTNVGTITLEIIEARGLKSMDINGLSDPYVKIWLMHDGKKVEKKKTVIHEKNLNPVFNETFMFSVPYERIRQTSLVISVMDYDRVGRNDKIGQIILGSKSGAMEVKHWNEMFANCRTSVAKWHILKDFD